MNEGRSFIDKLWEIEAGALALGSDDTELITELSMDIEGFPRSWDELSKIVLSDLPPLRQDIEERLRRMLRVQTAADLSPG